MIENLEREDLNSFEQTEGVLQLLVMKLDMDTADLPPSTASTKALKKSFQRRCWKRRAGSFRRRLCYLGLISGESFVNYRLPPLNLPNEILESLCQGRITYTKAQAISRMKKASSLQKLLEEVIKENLSLREIQAHIKALHPGPEMQSPKATIETVSRRVSKATLWKNLKKWKQAHTLLSKLEALLAKD